MAGQLIGRSRIRREIISWDECWLQESLSADCGSLGKKSRKGGTEEKKLWQAGTDSLCLFFVLQHLGNRLGCFGRGCCYGIAYQGPGAVFYSQGVPAQDGIAYSVFPSQLFEAVLMLVLLAGFLWLYWREKRCCPGSVWALGAVSGCRNFLWITKGSGFWQEWMSFSILPFFWQRRERGSFGEKEKNCKLGQFPLD